MFLSVIDQNKFVNLGIPLKVVKIFKYGKNNDNYWKEKNLLKQVVEKALFIPQALYLGYQLLFLFNNMTSYLVLALSAFQVDKTN